MSWVKMQFKDAVLFPPKVVLEKGENYSFIPMEDLSSGIKYVLPNVEKTWSGSGGAKFEEGDTLFARITPCLQNGKIAQAKGLKNGKGFCSTEYFIFRGIEGVTDTDFVYYLSLNEEFKKNAIGSMVGASGRQRADQKFVGEYEINLPPLHTQKRIASILSTYDDLIENNLNRIKLLEETAQNIYKEWFVNFRFPNYENTPINQETGLPEGWEVSNLGNVCTKISSGGTPSRNKHDFWNEKDYPWVKTKELQDNFIFEVEEYISKTALENSSAKLFQEGSVVMAIYASPTLGRLGILTKECCFNQAMVGFQVSHKISNHFLYLKLIEERKNLNNKAIGAAQQNISVQKVKDHEIILPKQELIEIFTKKVEIIFSQKRILGEQNQKLKEARDILLPRLMNRTIEV
jgi:type I restriction enzyme S subunit